MVQCIQFVLQSKIYTLFINVLCHYKRQISMLRFIALREVRTHENVEHSQRKENVVYRDRSRVVELLLQLTNNKSCKKFVEIQHKHMYSLYIGSLCNVAFPTARFIPASWLHRWSWNKSECEVPLCLVVLWKT